MFNSFKFCIPKISHKRLARMFSVIIQMKGTDDPIVGPLGTADYGHSFDRWSSQAWGPACNSWGRHSVLVTMLSQVVLTQEARFIPRPTPLLRHFPQLINVLFSWLLKEHLFGGFSINEQLSGHSPVLLHKIRIFYSYQVSGAGGSLGPFPHHCAVRGDW